MGNYSGTINIYDFELKYITNEFFGHNSEVNGLICPYLFNKYILISSSKTTFKVWDLISNSLIKTISSNSSSVCGIIYPAINEYKDLFISTNNSLINCWSALSNSAKSLIKNNLVKQNDNLLEKNKNVKLMNDTTNELDFDIIEETSFINKQKQLENFNPYARKINVIHHNDTFNNMHNITYLKDDTISDLNEGNETQSNHNTEFLVFSIEAHRNDIKSALVNTKHKILITGGVDYNIVITDLINQKIKKKIIDHTASVNSLDSINEDIFASASQDSNIKLFNLNNLDKCLFTISASKVGINFVLNLREYYDKLVLLIGNSEGELKIFDLLQKRYISKIKHKGILSKGELFKIKSLNLKNYDIDNSYSGVLVEDDFSLIFFKIFS